MDTLAVENGHANGYIDPIMQENGADVAPSKEEEFVNTGARVEDADKTGGALVDVEAETLHPQFIREDLKTPSELKHLANKIPKAPTDGEEHDPTLMDALLPASAMNSGDSIETASYSNGTEIDEVDAASISEPTVLPSLEDAFGKASGDELVDEVVPEANASETPGAVEEIQDLPTFEDTPSEVAQTPASVAGAIDAVETETSPKDSASIGAGQDLPTDAEPAQDVVAATHEPLEAEVGASQDVEETTVPSNDSDELAPTENVAEPASAPDVEPPVDNPVTIEDSAASNAEEDAVTAAAEDEKPEVDATAPIVDEVTQAEDLAAPSDDEPVAEELEATPADIPEPELAAPAVNTDEVDPQVDSVEDSPLQEAASDLGGPAVDEVDSVPAAVEVESEHIAQPVEEKAEGYPIEAVNKTLEQVTDLPPVDDAVVDSLVGAAAPLSESVEEIIEQPAVKETIEQPALEDVVEQPAVEEISAEPVVEENTEALTEEEPIEPTPETAIEEPAEEEAIEQVPIEDSAPVVKETIEDPALEETTKEPALEETVEQPTAETATEEPAEEGVVEEVTVEEPAIAEGVEDPVIERTVAEPEESEEEPAPAMGESIEQPAIEESVEPPAAAEDTERSAIKETIEQPILEETATIDELDVAEEKVAEASQSTDLSAPVEESTLPPSIDESVVPVVEESAPVALAAFDEQPASQPPLEPSADDMTVPLLAEEASEEPSLEEVPIVADSVLEPDVIDAPFEPAVADQIEETSFPTVESSAEESPAAKEETLAEIAPATVQDAAEDQMLASSVPAVVDVSVADTDVASEDADVPTESAKELFVETGSSSAADDIPVVAVQAATSSEHINAVEESTTEPSLEVLTALDAPEEASTQPTADELLEAQADSEPNEDVTPPSEPIVDAAPLIVEPVDATPIDTASLGPASPVERPKSPWTPSYSVTSQGPGLTPEEDIPAIEDIVPEDTPTSHIPEVAITTVESLPVSESPALTEVPRPTSPWTPSYSTSVQGSPAVHPAELEETIPSVPEESATLLEEIESAVEASVEQIIDGASSAVEEDVPPVSQTEDFVRQAPTVEITEPPVVEDEIIAEPPVAEETLVIPSVAIQDSTQSPGPISERPPSPWTPSYSISQQGNNRSSENLLTDAAQNDVDAVESVGVSATGSFIDVTASAVQPELPRPTSPWTPSYSVSHLGTEEVDPVSVVVDDSADVVPEPAIENAEVNSSPTVMVEDTSSEEATAPDAPVAEIERPWTPSYSVTQQGSASPAPGGLAVLEETAPAEPQAEDEEDEDDGDAKSLSALIAPIAVLTAATAGSGPTSPLNQPSALPEEKEQANDDAKSLSAIVAPIAVLASAVASPDQLATPSDIERPWTPSYSVTSQGPGSPQPPPSSDLPAPKSKESSESKLEVPALSIPRPASPSWTPSYSVSSLGPSSPAVSAKEFLASDSREAVDTLEPLPSPSGLSFPRDDDLTSLDTLSSLPESRKRVESSVSSVSSKYFPGGWFSRPSLVTETRRSLESATGEFTPVTPAKTETESLPATEGTDATESVEDDGSSTDSDDSDESDDKRKRGSWCVVM